jgi:hypothetical protein
LGASNPSTGHTIIELNIASSCAAFQLALVIRRAAGNTVFRQVLKEGYNNVTILTREWQPGLYFYSLELMNKTEIARKLTVVQ